MKTSTEATTSLARELAVFSAGEDKKKRARASLTVARLCRVSTPVSLRFSQDHEEKRFPSRSTGSILLYFFLPFHFFFSSFRYASRPRSLAGRFAPPLASTPARTVFAKLSGAAAAAAVDNKRYASHTDSREILNTVAHLRRVHGGKERPDGPISPGPPPVPAGILRKEDRPRTRRAEGPRGERVDMRDERGWFPSPSPLSSSSSSSSVDEFIEEKLGGL